MTSRYRCDACGNLTRFDVTSTKTTRAYHHFTVGGELVVEDEEILEETVHEVACRWCGHGRAVEVLDGPHNQDATTEPASGHTVR
jgi:hypothetical protein